MAYVEFGDEEAMKAGLEKHAEVSLLCIETAIILTIITETE